MSFVTATVLMILSVFCTLSLLAIGLIALARLREANEYIEHLHQCIHAEEEAEFARRTPEENARVVERLVAFRAAYEKIQHRQELIERLRNWTGPDPYANGDVEIF